MTNISIVIPVYNVEPYIKECLESVQHQTMTDGVECILVDDCGTDKSVEIIESFIASYEGDIKFKLIHHDHNKGLSEGRNSGMDIAEGEYIYFLDSDDYISDFCLEALWTLAKKYPKAEVIHGTAYTEDAVQNEDFHLGINKYHLPEYSDDVNFVRTESILCHYSIHAWDALFKKKFIKDNKLRFLPGVTFEDVPWKMDFSRKVTAIAYCNRDTYYYRQRESSIMTSLSPKCLKSVALNCDHMLENISTGNTFKIELFRIIEFMQIYDRQFNQNPLEMMEFGKSKVFGKLYQLMRKDKLSIFQKIDKSVLINLFRVKMLCR